MSTAKGKDVPARAPSSDTESQPTKRSKQGFYTVSAAACRKGVRDEMQDTHVMLDDFSPLLKEPYAKQVRFYAVYDGHAGKNASEYCAEHLHRNLAPRLPADTAPKGFGGRMKRCLTETYTTTDKGFLTAAAAQTPPWKDGCTAATAVFVDAVIFAANVGDTRMYVGRLDETQTMKPIALSKVHVATLYEERQRIQKAGGKVVDGRIQGIMEVSRTIGDGRFKTLGVTAQPNVSKCTLTPKDHFLLIACDGLWDHLTPADAATFIWDKIKAAKETGIPLDVNCAQGIANQLVNEAVHRGSDDNVSALIVLFHNIGSDEQQADKA